MNNPDYISAVVKIRKGDALTDEEAVIVQMEIEATLLDWALVYGLVYDGILEEETIPIPNWQDTFHESNWGYAEVWSANKHLYSPAFVQLGRERR